MGHKQKKKELYESIYKDNFSFGANWKKFLKKISTSRIEEAQKSLCEFTDLQDFKGKTFLDLGCGSGLFSLAATKMGAKVVSVDVDQSSIECAKMLRKKFKVSSSQWKIMVGSALDEDLRIKLPIKDFDIVYSWGVLHHTGDMYSALANAALLVKPKGLLYVAIYNNFRGFPFSSKTWVDIKKFYNKRGKLVKKAMRTAYSSFIVAGLIAYRKNPITYIRDYSSKTLRGMDFFVDIEDWMGGYPYEYATTDQISAFYKKKGFILKKVKKTQREGCNEFLFRRK